MNHSNVLFKPNFTNLLSFHYFNRMQQKVTAVTEKVWFKYAFGFVNIDCENLYLTNTGNWTEARKLPEKTGKSKLKNSLRRIRIIGFFSLVLLILSSLLVLQFLGTSASIISITLIAASIYYLYRYLSRESGVAFRIPRSKITSIEQTENTCTIHFANGEANNDSERITKVEEKGIAILKSMANEIN